MFPTKERYKQEKRKYCCYYLTCSLLVLYLLKSLIVSLLRTLSLIKRGDHHFKLENKTSIQSSSLTKLFPQYHGKLEEKKLAAVLTETPESTRNSIAQNKLDPELAQDYISQVSEETEGRVTKKL